MRHTLVKTVSITAGLLSAGVLANAQTYGTYSSYSSGSTSTYSTGTHTACPAGSTKSADGVCIASHSSGSTGSAGISSWSGSTSGQTSGWSGTTHASSPRVTIYSGASSYETPVSQSYSGVTTSSSSGSWSSQSSYTGGTTYASSPTTQSSSYGYTSSTVAACPPGSHRSEGVCVADSSGTSYSGTTSEVQVVPFSTGTTTASISNYRLDGMGANEFLSPTSCPTSVYNPQGAQVLGCYNVVKPVAPRPVVTQTTQYHQVRVVRPIIYVRYPVPTPYYVPVAMPRPVLRPVPVFRPAPIANVCRGAATRYGNNWPGRACGW